MLESIIQFISKPASERYIISYTYGYDDYIRGIPFARNDALVSAYSDGWNDAINDMIVSDIHGEE